MINYHNNELEVIDDVKVGQSAMAKIFPKQKCITKPRYYGPLKVVVVHGKGRMILMKDDEGNVIRRNIRDIKKWKGIEKERPHYQIN